MRRIAALLAALPALAAPGSFTLQQILSAPFASELVASRDGRHVAWVANQRGVRNVWTAAAPDWTGAQLTSYTADDGTDIAQLSWTPDGSAVVYVRGGDFEFPERPFPNPASNPAGTDQAIWIAAPGSAPRKLAEGHSPALAPSGSKMAFLKADQVWTVDAAGDPKPFQLIHTKGEADELRWSPDSERLAFVSHRGDHSFIGVYDLSAKRLAWLDPSVDTDSSPAWSPDVKQIAFIRQPASRERFRFGPKRTAEPWSIRIANVDGTGGREIWAANSGPGSVFHSVVADDQLQWAGADRIIFPWERDGWVHLYSVPIAGRDATLLTPGQFEVEHVAATPDHAGVFYSSNEGDIDRRHVWRVAASGGTRIAVTQGQGIEFAPVAVDSGVAFLHADVRRPSRPAIQTDGAQPRDLAPNSIPDDFPANALVTPEQVVFAAADGQPIHGQLFLPPSAKRGERRPALLFLHGGSRRQMLLGWHSMYYYSNAYAMNQYLASQGYVVLSVNYRSGIGYGLNFREAENYGATGASEFQDVQGAALYLRNRADVDPARIGLWGGSYGGYLTALGLARASDLFKAGVDFHGVHDWNIVIRNFDSTYEPGKAADAGRLAFESSPMASVATWRSPVLLIHGDDDRNVPFSETVNLVEALRKRHVPFEELIFPDEIHDFLTGSAWLRAYEATANFFKRKL